MLSRDHRRPQLVSYGPPFTGVQPRGTKRWRGCAVDFGVSFRDATVVLVVPQLLLWVVESESGLGLQISIRADVRRRDIEVAAIKKV